MKKVSKKTKFLAVVLGSLLISSSAFAVDLTIDNSAVKRATAGQFDTDSDRVNAKDIFDLERSFFSAGYLGQAAGGAINGGGNGTTTAKGLNNGVQGSFGVALPNGMYLGIGAAYNFKDSADYTTGKDTINGTKWQIGSTANVIAAFRINEMIALHYNFTLEGTTPYNVYQTKNTAGDDYKTYNNQGSWRHEIAAAVKFGEHKLTVPVSVTFNAYNTKEKGTKYLNTDTGMAKIDVDNVDYIGGDGIWLGLNPEFFLSLPMGPMTGINMGLNLEAKLTHNVGKNGVFAENNTGVGQTTYIKNEYKTTQKAAAVNIGVWASFPMEWSLGNDQVSLAMEPQINLDFGVNNFGKYEQSINGGAATVSSYGSDYFAFSPSIELPIGTLWRPVEWYELRFGTALILGANVSSTQSKDANGDNANKTTGYDTYSGIAGFFGMGFIVGEDFNIDLYAEAQQLNFFTMGFGGQLTYRFN